MDSYFLVITILDTFALGLEGAFLLFLAVTFPAGLTAGKKASPKAVMALRSWTKPVCRAILRAQAT